MQAAEDPNSPLRRSVTEGLVSFGRQLEPGDAMAAKVDGWVATPPVTSRATTPASITGIIDETIARWDGEATSRKIELQVGRDLQFIRINGTVVGALAGLVIYTLAELFLWSSCSSSLFGLGVGLFLSAAPSGPSPFARTNPRCRCRLPRGRNGPRAAVGRLWSHAAHD